MSDDNQNNLNIGPDPKPLTMGNLIQKARDDWSKGKKNEAFQTAMSGMTLLSKGIAKLMKDVDAIKKHTGAPDPES